MAGQETKMNVPYGLLIVCFNVCFNVHMLYMQQTAPPPSPSHLQGQEVSLPPIDRQGLKSDQNCTKPINGHDGFRASEESENETQLIFRSPSPHTTITREVIYPPKYRVCPLQRHFRMTHSSIGRLVILLV